MHVLRSMLSSFQFPIILRVSESNRWIKLALYNWPQYVQQLVSIRVTQRSCCRARWSSYFPAALNLIFWKGNATADSLKKQNWMVTFYGTVFVPSFHPKLTHFGVYKLEVFSWIPKNLWCWPCFCVFCCERVFKTWNRKKKIKSNGIIMWWLTLYILLKRCVTLKHFIASINI